MSEVQQEFDKLAERINQLKATETQAAAERALLEATLVALYVPVTDKSVDKVVKDGWQVEVTRNIEYKIKDIPTIKKNLSEEQFMTFCKVVFEFSKSGYNSLIKTALALEIIGTTREEKGLHSKLVKLFADCVSKEVKRPSVKTIKL